MKIRPQIEVPGVKQGASVTSQTQGGTQSHFDAALLQAAQTVWDASDQDAEVPLSPKVQQALSSALEQLNQKTTSQLQALARAPQSLAALTAGLAQADGLNKAQATQLNRLLLAALPRLLAYKANVETSVASGSPSPSGPAQNGSQGANSTPAFSVGFSALLNARSGVTPLNADAHQDSNAGQAPSGNFNPLTTGVPSAPQDRDNQAQTPGTPSFSQSSAGFAAFSGSGTQTPISSGTGQSDSKNAFTGTDAPISGPTQGRVFSVLGNPGQGPTAGFKAPEAGTVPFFEETASGAADLPSFGSTPTRVQGSGFIGATDGASNQANTQGPINGSLGSGQGQNQGQTPVQNQGAGQNQLNVSATSQNGTTETGFPVLLDLGVQWTDSGVSVPIQEGSQITLKGDGSWVLPQGATVPAPKPQNQAGQQSTVQIPETTGPQGQQPGAIQEDQTLFTAPAPQPFAFQTGSSDEPQTPSTPAPGSVNVGSALELALQDAVPQEDGTTQSFGNGTQPSSPPTTGQQGSGPSQGPGTGLSQVLSSQQLTAQSPSLTQVFQTGPSQGQQQTGARAGFGLGPQSSPGGQSEAFAGALAAQTPGAVNSGNGSPSGQGSGGPLSSFGQNSLSLWGSDVLAGGVAQQVTNALNQTGAAPGRLVIQLSPASLGNVQVDLSMVDGKLTAHLVTSQQDVRDVLARDLTGFKAGLESHGITVNEVSVALRSGVGGQQQGSSRQAPQDGWEGFSQTPSANPGASAPVGASAYAASPSDGQPGFNALA